MSALSFGGGFLSGRLSIGEILPDPGLHGPVYCLVYRRYEPSGVYCSLTLTGEMSLSEMAVDEMLLQLRVDRLPLSL